MNTIISFVALIVSNFVSFVALIISIIAIYLVHFRGPDIRLLTRGMLSKKQEDYDYQPISIIHQGEETEKAEIKIHLPFINEGTKSGIIVKARCVEDLKIDNIDRKKWKKETGEEFDIKIEDLSTSCYFKQPREYEGQIDMSEDIFSGKEDILFRPVIIRSGDTNLTELSIVLVLKRKGLLGTLLRHCKEMVLNIEYSVIVTKGIFQTKEIEARKKSLRLDISNVLDVLGETPQNISREGMLAKA